jgi:murein DD-endopeptidase MepM/ murein hydrolase activator NlpD
VSSRKERDRYRGRRRIPTPPRSRYTAVATTALIGAGVVAMATAAAMPDMKDSGSIAGLNGNSIASRGVALDRANRSSDRSTDASTSSQAWLLPLASYTYTASPFGERPGVVQKGFDLSAPEGTPFYAAAKGTVTLARWLGGYGYTVIVDVGDGTQIVYAHASKLLVHENQQVNAGDLLALTGSTGYSFTPHLHVEVRVNGVAVPAIGAFSDHQADVINKKDALHFTG